MRLSISMPNTIIKYIFIFIFNFLFLCISLAAQEQPLDISGLDSLLPAETLQSRDIKVSENTEKPASNNTVSENFQSRRKVADTNTANTGLSLTVLIQGGGPIGYVIILLSFIAAALIIEHCLSFRRKKFISPAFADEVLQLIQQGQFAPALKKCREDQSILARTLAESMPEFEFGWEAVEKKAEETMAEHANRCYRKIEYLNLIGSIAPMLGLLGTVVGMVIAFNQLAESEGYASAADLAGGIYLALVTTVQGLLVAIPALAAFSYFGSRIAALMSETATAAERTLMPIKKGLLKKTKTA